MSTKKPQNQFSFQTILNVFLFAFTIVGFSATFFGTSATSEAVSDFFEEKQGEHVFLSKDAGNSYSMDCHSFFSHELLSDLLEVEETKTETKNELKDSIVNESASLVFSTHSFTGKLQRILFLHLLHDFETRKHISLFVLYHSWRSLLG